MLGKREVNSRAYCSAFNFKGADQQKKVGALSGGERNRVHLAKMLKSGANVLLLDEPTNDLDVDTLRALEEALEDFAGCAVIISHDRWFLDRIATHILAFEGDSHVEWFEGNFQDYEEDKMRRLGDGFDHPAPDQVQEVLAVSGGGPPAILQIRRWAARSAFAAAVALDAHLRGDRAGVAHVLDVMNLVAALEPIEVAGQQRVAVEVEQAAFLGHQEAEVLLGRDFGDLTEGLVACVVVRILAAAVALALEVDELSRGDAERLVDRLVQVGVPVLAQQVIGLVADHEVAAAGNAELDMDHRRDRAAAILRALVDADAAGGEPVVELFEVGDASADLLLRPSRLSMLWKAISSGTCSIGNSTSSALFAAPVNARRGRIVAMGRRGPACARCCGPAKKDHRRWVN